ncbi:MULTISPECIES: ATPase [unclassified Sphingomonas]|mgnify:CR=1 FL=1|uniref:F0F1 ATP synthase subunit B family protein n=1 Tax=unclassified Sphingomonas TaxID=196159 RepID=UPI000927BE05|nr:MULTISPECIES: ATPase [unclassified Sphingomonas]MBN8848472.1 ATPase [Sphingomonas sp.]OJV32106.1 MAG: ATPase [Sphingomonas sp. 67-36]
MPQISQLAATYASQIFWLLLTFGIVFFIVGRGMLPRVQKTIDSRDRSIADDLAAASRARDEADKAEEAWRLRDHANREKAQALVAEARARAAKATEATLHAANEEQAVKIAAGEAEVRAATNRALDEIEAVAAEAAQDIVARVSGASVTADEARGAVKAAMANG